MTYITISNERTAMDTPKIIVGEYTTLRGAKCAATRWYNTTGHTASIYDSRRAAECGYPVVIEETNR